LPGDEDDDNTYFFKNKISDFRLFTVRNIEGYTRGGPLVKGSNEIVGDFLVLCIGQDHGNMAWDIEAVARLPDHRILFAFEARVEYKY
jgi:hypothetical protein